MRYVPVAGIDNRYSSSRAKVSILSLPSTISSRGGRPESNPQESNPCTALVSCNIQLSATGSANTLPRRRAKLCRICEEDVHVLSSSRGRRYRTRSAQSRPNGLSTESLLNSWTILDGDVLTAACSWCKGASSASDPECEATMYVRSAHLFLSFRVRSVLAKVLHTS